MLLDRGFNATYIETEDIHLDRRHKEAIQEKRLKEWAQAKNHSEKNGTLFIPPISKVVLYSKFFENIWISLVLL